MSLGGWNDRKVRKRGLARVRSHHAERQAARRLPSRRGARNGGAVARRAALARTISATRPGEAIMKERDSLRTVASIRTLLARLGSLPINYDKVHFDGDLPGFGLRVRASGVHTWMIQYAIAGRTRRVVLGLASALDPGKARATAQKLLAQVRLGKDPAADKARARVAAAETFGALLPRFLERQRTRLKPRSYVETERHLQRHAKALHGSPIEAVARRTVAARLAEIEKHNGPAARNRVRASLSAYFTWAAKEGYVDNNPVAFTNKAEEKARERVLSDEELRTIWLAADDSQFGAIVKLLILTGTRRSEIGGLMWSEASPTLLTLPPARTKNGREHLVPLSE